jgi:hypothetical protein
MLALLEMLLFAQYILDISVIKILSPIVNLQDSIFALLSPESMTEVSVLTAFPYCQIQTQYIIGLSLEKCYANST